MLRFKSIAPRVFPRIQNNVYKLYSKAAEQLKPTINATENQTELTTNTIPTESIVIDKVSTEILKTKEAEGVSAEVKKGSGCNKKVAPKGKKGKKCGQPKPVAPQDPGPPGGYYIQDKCGVYDIPKTNSKKWKTISYALVPLALGLSALVLATKEEHPDPDYIPYEYMYRRTKRFPWRDGKTSLFHGPNNLIPEEEEERLDREAEEKQNQAPPPPPSTPPKKGDPPAPPPEKEVRYKKHVNEEEEKIKKREQYAQEELERRKKRHEEESLKN